MRNLMLAAIVALVASAADAAPRLVFIKMAAKAGGDTTYRLEVGGDSSYRDPTSRVEYYQKAGVWTLRSTLDGDIIWTKPTDPFELGGGFTIQSNTSKFGAPAITIVQTVD
jgi:hypothetical protein